MYKRFLVLTILTGVVALGIFSANSYAAEEVTLSTYYPAPYGDYDELNALELNVIGLATYNNEPGGLHVINDTAADPTPDGHVQIGYDVNIDAGFIRTYQTGVGDRPLVINAQGTSLSRVGIGTTVPGATLDINALDSPVTAGGWREAIRFSDTAPAGTNPHSAITFPAGGLLFGMHGNRNFYFGDMMGGTMQKYVMIIEADTGNVSIGGAYPAYQLDVGGPVAGISLDGSTGSPDAGVIRFGDNTGWKLHFGRAQESVGAAYNVGSAGTLMTIQDNGRVGIGITSPQQALHVANDRMMIFGPNSTYSANLLVGGQSQGMLGADDATYGVSNGNLHLDSRVGGYATYINWYGGTLGTHIGNGSSGYGALTKGSGSFDIAHPDPAKEKEGWRLKHCFVESPTRGDNIYRWQVDVKDGQADIILPGYFKHLNENVQLWVSPVRHFGRAYAETDKAMAKIYIKAERDGSYNVLAVGTRKDKTARDGFDKFGVEYQVKKQDMPPSRPAAQESNI
ncbi:MAG: hypothetical protein HQ558_06180 [Candidatus Omnitrophica bacterium]|nr:hypothetical protein [Candidatus Omnitrophota bacterium]